MTFLSLQRVCIMCCISACAFFAGYRAGTARDTLIAMTPLLSSSETILGEPFAYPAGKPRITAAVMGLAPGQETGWHTHGVPLVGFVLDGELTVDYGDKGTRTYKAGDALIESSLTAHNGRNAGTGNVRLFALFMGADGVPNSLPVKK